MFSVFLDFERDLIFAFFLDIVFLKFGILICLSVISLGDIRKNGEVEIGEERYVEIGAGRLGASVFSSLIFG